MQTNQATTNDSAVPDGRKGGHWQLIQQLDDRGTMVELYGRESQGRKDVEHYIRQAFREVYDARITEFMPWLMTTECPGLLSAAVGIRPAADRSLYLEQYLDQPIEEIIAARLDAPRPGRQVIAEIGNLVATGTGASHLLFLIFTAVLYRSGYRWIVFTATGSVLKSIRRLRYEPHVLCPADPSRLEEPSRQRWGSYYRGQPAVLAGSLDTAMEQASQNRLFRDVLAHYEDTVSTHAHRLARLQAC